MSKKNAANEAAKKKTAKEKKMLVVLAVLLVLALGYAYKTLSKLHSSAAPTVAVSATTPGAAAATAPAATPSSSTPASPAAPAVAPAGSSTTSSPGRLVSAVTPPLDQGQLRTFTLFDSKDPFDSAGPPAEPEGGHASGSTSKSTSSRTPAATARKTATKPSGSAPKVPAAPLTSAVVSVNGSEALVSLHGVFPVTSDPATNGLFRLVSLTQKSARVAIVGGSYASGAQTLTLHVGQPVTLANTADGKRYTLELFPQGTVAPAPPASAGTTTTTTTTPSS